MDVHKSASQVCILTEDGELKERRIRTEGSRLAAVLGGRPRARVLLEASTESEWVARCVESLGHEVIVADPNFAPMYATRSRRVKTDRRDARALAEACQLGAYRPAHRVSEARQRIRRQLVVREALVRTRTRYIGVVGALLRREGMRIPSGAPATFVDRIELMELDGRLKSAIAPILAVMLPLRRQVEYGDAELAGLAASDPVVRRLCTVPSIGPVTAASFVATLDGVERFGGAHQVEAYLGLVPRERSSGEKQGRGGITKAGHTRTRWLLVEAAWSILCRKRPEAEPLWRWADRIATRRGRHVAALALARRLAGILYALWRDDVDYDPAWVGRRDHRVAVP